MKKKRIVSTLLALLLFAGLPVSALADTWDISNGDITVPSKALEAGMVNALTLSTEGVSMQLQNNKSIAYSDILQIMN